MASNMISRIGTNLPDRGTTIAALAASILLYYATATALAWYRLRAFPGPPLASVSHLWGFLAVASGQCHTTMARAQARYGRAMRIGPDALMVYDPDTVRHINSARSAYGRGGWYESTRFHPEGHSVFSEMDTARHDRRKAKLAFGFSGKGLMDVEADIDAQLSALVGHIRGRIRGGGGGDKLDFSKVIRWFQLDLITLAGLGEAWGDLADETDHFDFLESMDSVVPFIHSISMVPLLRKIVFSKLFLYLTAPRVTDKKGLGSSMGVMRSAVNARFEESVESKQGRPRGGMLGEWIKHGLSPKECEWDLAVQMPAGTETSITVVRGTLLHLLSSPNAYQKLKQEIADGIREGRISKPVTNDQAKGMPYLQAVLNEGMRIVPPVISGFPKKVPPGGDTICGKFVPEGTEIYVNFSSMMKNTEIFGQDVDIFRPERFLECDATTKARMLKTVDLAFGYGRWLCLGKSLAQIEMNKIFVELLRVFDFQIINAEQPWKRRGYTTSVIEGFDLRVLENALD